MHSTDDGYLGHFHFVAIMQKAATNLVEGYEHPFLPGIGSGIG